MLEDVLGNIEGSQYRLKSPHVTLPKHYLIASGMMANDWKWSKLFSSGNVKAHRTIGAVFLNRGFTDP